MSKLAFSLMFTLSLASTGCAMELEGPGSSGALATQTTDDAARPESFTLSLAGWDVPVGARYSLDTLTAGPLCRAGRPLFRAQPLRERALGQHDAAGVLKALGVPDVPAEQGLVSLGLDEEARGFAEQVEGDPERSRNMVVGMAQFAGFLELENTGQVQSCQREYVREVLLGQSFVHGLRLDFASAEDAAAFSDTYGSVASLFSDDTDRAAAEAWFAEHPATVTAFVGQVGAEPLDVSDVLDEARCATDDLQGCADLLSTLQGELEAFFAAAAVPTAEDFGTTSPMVLVVEGNWW